MAELKPVAPPIWTLEDALDLIRPLQPLARDVGYHITLGGGVLNLGVSAKDLDLFCLPLNGGEGDKAALWVLLDTVLGPLLAIRDSPDYQPEAMWHYRDMLHGAFEGKRVDLFIQ